MKKAAGDVCLLGHQYKCTSWPSEEHAAFSFARLASPGQKSIDKSEFTSALKHMQLDFNLSDHELDRVFNSLDANNDGRLSLDEFKSGRTESPFMKALVESLSGSRSLTDAGDNFPHPEFDWNVSTSEFYSAPLESGFHGGNIYVRKRLDYSYHSNYTEDRQHFQDELIKSNVLLEGAASERPWYVLTSGPMGSGKGWVLGWMSANSILSLERVAKIDPDSFKLRMPEWSIYQHHSKSLAGTRTHSESSYIAEIAQHLAMDNNMDVWVDGSLRNSDWYENELQRIRQSYPHYRIAIVAISAPEEMIETNIKQRAIATGRDIPKEMRGMAVDKGSGIDKLTHLVDLVASVRNNSAGSEPDLRFVSLVDRSGNWDLIRQLTHT